MKKLLKNILCTGMLLACTGCHDYLDIRTPGIVNEDLQFEDVQGYRDAMFGIYGAMNNADLYGGALSYGIIDDLAQLYDPGINAGKDAGQIPLLEKALKYKYRDALLRPVIDNIWTTSYMVISAANNVIAHHTANKTNIPESDEFKAFKGEALAIRALMHFNLVRLFCKNIIMTPKAKGIPYATEFSLNPPLTRPIAEVYKLIISDLTEAQKWLSADREIEIVSNDISQRTGYSVKIEYLANRFAQLNLYAVKAILARVYLTMGDYSKAAQYAREVVDSEKFALNPPGKIGVYRRYSLNLGPGTECILSLYNNTLYGSVFGKFVWPADIRNRNPTQCKVRSDVASIYEAQKFTAKNYDRRYQAYFKFVRSFRGFQRLVDGKEEDEVRGGVKYSYRKITGVTLVRLPELYYILSECLYDTNRAAAIGYFNKVRNSRGLADIEEKDIKTKALFLDKVLKERLKEFWGEGLIFYDYKRLNMDIKDIDGNIIKASDTIYVFPLPEKEIEFGK